MSEPFGVAMFCDDIRYEIDGRQTYVGVYGPQLDVIGIAPAYIPKLACSVLVVIPFDNAFDELRVVLRLDTDDDSIMLAEFVQPGIPPSTSPDKVNRAQINVVLSPLVIERDCTLRARAFLDSREIKVGALNIQLIPPEAAGPPMI